VAAGAHYQQTKIWLSSEQFCQTDAVLLSGFRNPPAGAPGERVDLLVFFPDPHRIKHASNRVSRRLPASLLRIQRKLVCFRSRP